MFNGPEKVRSLSENLDLGGNIYALKLKYKEIPPAFFFSMHLGYKSMVVAESLGWGALIPHSRNHSSAQFYLSP